MILYRAAAISLVIFGAVYEVGTLLYATYSKKSHWIEHLASDLNFLVDHIVLFYSVIVIFVCLYFAWQRNKPAGHRYYPSMKKDGTQNWKDTIQGTWHQYEAENLEAFGDLTDESQIRRTLGAIAFYKVRHTITLSGGYFILQRDLGMAISVWDLKAKMGKDRESAEPTLVEVETGGKYCFRVWIDEEKELLHMESSPGEGQEGVTTLQTRSLINKDEMQMV